VLDMADLNRFNSGNGWTGLTAAVNRHQVVVDGNAGDTVAFDTGWMQQTGTVTKTASPTTSSTTPAVLRRCWWRRR